MKTNLKNFLGLAVLGLTLLINTVPTQAGYVGASEVSIHTNQVGIYASGSMAGARYSKDSKQSIGCYIIFYRHDDGIAPFMGCSARDSTGKEVHCHTPDLRYREAVQGMTDSSYIYFSLPQGGTYCNDIQIYDGSDQLK